MASNVVLSTQDYNVVGTRPIRHDGTDKVTGRAQYGADIQLPGLLHAKILRSPHPHARILSIDTSRALALPGVKAVVTSKDFPQPSGKVTDLGEGAMVNLKFLSNNCLAGDKVLYKGHAVAAVAATSSHVAEQALSLIDVKYDHPAAGDQRGGRDEGGRPGPAREADDPVEPGDASGRAAGGRTTPARPPT